VEADVDTTLFQDWELNNLLGLIEERVDGNQRLYNLFMYILVAFPEKV
jgi:hypothetical protein